MELKMKPGISMFTLSVYVLEKSNKF